MIPLALLAAALLHFAPAAAQQVTGMPGSPAATTMIDGKYLPPQPPKFGGTINPGTPNAKSATQRCQAHGGTYIAALDMCEMEGDK
jgi:hypothetical protein